MKGDKDRVLKGGREKDTRNLNAGIVPPGCPQPFIQIAEKKTV